MDQWIIVIKKNTKDFLTGERCIANILKLLLNILDAIDIILVSQSSSGNSLSNITLIDQRIVCNIFFFHLVLQIGTTCDLLGYCGRSYLNYSVRFCG